LFFLLMFALSACAAPPGPGGPPAAAQTPAGPGVQRTLESHRWTLESATDAKGRPVAALPPGAERPLMLNFADGRVGIEGGCNRMFGPFQIDADGRLKVGRLGSTMMACEPGAMQADAALADLLAQPLKIDLTAAAEPTLRLTSAANATLTLRGQLTPEARYGPPTQIFLEVAAQPVACAKPPAGANACLQVRERRYDAQGLLVGTPGPWQPFAEPIEGFTHRPGERTVLRIKRFQRDVAGGGSPAVYVLDLVVETEVVPR
jgi:heat shock protein HslJ